MKIGLVCPYDVFKGGGVQEIVLATQRELSRRGHNVKVLTPLPRDKDGHRDENVIFIGRSADVKSPFHTTAQVSVNLDNSAIDEILAAEKFDVLHFHEPWVPMVSMQILARSTSVNVATFHAKLPETMMSRTIERVITPYTKSIMKYLHCLTAVSPAAAEYVSSITDDPVKIIPNGIDVDLYRKVRRQPEKGTATILYIGRLERRKGVIQLLKAFRQLLMTDPDVQLIVAGDGPHRQKLETYARERCEGKVTFTGYVSLEEKLRLFGAADLFVAPSLFGESFGIVLLEAMAAGVPLVAGNNPGYMSVLKGTGELSIVNPKDAEAFARRMSLLLRNDELRGVWLDWAKDYVQQFSYAAIVDHYEALFSSLIKKS